MNMYVSVGMMDMINGLISIRVAFVYLIWKRSFTFSWGPIVDFLDV